MCYAALFLIASIKLENIKLFLIFIAVIARRPANKADKNKQISIAHSMLELRPFLDDYEA